MNKTHSWLLLEVVIVKTTDLSQSTFFFLCYQQGLHFVLVFFCDLFFAPHSGKRIPTLIWASDSFDLPSKRLRREAKIRNIFLSKTSFQIVNSSSAQAIKCGPKWMELDEMGSSLPCQATSEIHYLLCHLLPYGRVMSSSFPKWKRNGYIKMLNKPVLGWQGLSLHALHISGHLSILSGGVNVSKPCGDRGWCYMVWHSSIICPLLSVLVHFGWQSQMRAFKSVGQKLLSWNSVVTDGW